MGERRGLDELGSADVVVVTHNSSSTVEECLSGLARQGDAVRRVQVVDNGSSDRTVAAASAAGSRLRLDLDVVQGANVGFARGVNAGIEALGGGGRRPVLCLNPDVLLHDGALGALLHVLAAEPRAGVVGGALVLPDGVEDPASRRRHPTAWGSGAYALLGRRLPSRWRYTAHLGVHAGATAGTAYRQVDATTGALMLVAPWVLRGRPRLFDEDYFMYGEDLQLCLDVERMGGRVLLVDEEVGLHVKGVSSGRPRGRRANVAFHDAMWRYYSKNLRRGPVEAAAVRVGVVVRFALTEVAAWPARAARQRSGGPRRAAA